MTDLLRREPGLLRWSILAAAAILAGAAIGAFVITMAWLEANLLNVYAPTLSSHGLLPVLLSAALLAVAWQAISYVADQISVDAPAKSLALLLFC